MTKRFQDARPFLFVIAGIVLMLDRLTKALIERNIPRYEAITIIPGILRLTHVLNPGAAFSIFADNDSKYKVAFLVAFSLVALAVVMSLLWKTGRNFTTGSLALAFILGGALGNLWDRLMQGQVIDFLEIRIVGYHWPDFNLADSAIVCGAILLISEILFRRPRPEKVAETSE